MKSGTGSSGVHSGKFDAVAELISTCSGAAADHQIPQNKRGESGAAVLTPETRAAKYTQVNTRRWA